MSRYKGIAMQTFGVALLLTTAANRALAADDEAIRDAIASYVDAFNRGDAEALADHWAEDAVYLNRATGQRVSGRAAIRAEFESLFTIENPGAHLEVEVDSIRLLADTVAVEEGTAHLTAADGQTVTSDYTAIHILRDGHWQLESVREIVRSTAPSHYAQLAELSWMVGEWVDESDEAVARTNCRWTKNRNYLMRTFSLTAPGDIALEGTQIIGWDPSQEQIRSWVFDSDGGFGAGIWRRDGDRWIVEATATLPDGAAGSATHVITYVDDDHFTWESIHREVDGQILPNVDPFTITRVQPVE